MAPMKWLLAIVLVFMAYPALAQQNQREDQQRTCEAVLGDRHAAAECQKIFAKDADCCIQYDAERLAKLCAKMSSIENALACFTEIHETGFRKSEMPPENEPGLADQYAQQWKKNVMGECMKETTTGAALDCAVLQKSGTKFVYAQKNEEIARQAAVADPIMQFCKRAFGGYWEGVEQCVKDQRAAKMRMGF